MNTQTSTSNYEREEIERTEKEKRLRRRIFGAFLGLMVASCFNFVNAGNNPQYAPVTPAFPNAWADADNNIKFMTILKDACSQQPSYSFCHGSDLPYPYDVALFCRNNKSDPVCVELSRGPQS
jgi:hypothetical protein